MAEEPDQTQRFRSLLNLDHVTLGERVERSEAIAVAILATAADPIILIDTAGTIMRVNQATSLLFGYHENEMLGNNVEMLMPEPYRGEHDGYIARYLSEGDPRIIGIGREVEAQRADGSVFPISLAVSEAKTEHDHMFTGIIHDLTRRNRQRDELETANRTLEEQVEKRTRELEDSLAELRRSNRDLEQFAYIASHDLRAPLRNVRQGLELLDEHLQETAGAGFDDEARELRELVLAAARRMESLIKGLLEFSRVQRHPVDDRAEHDLTSLVGEIVEMLRPEVAAVGGTISCDQLPVLTVNAMQMRQVFQNLVENAIRYRSRERNLDISIGAREPVGDPSGTVLIAVQDNGTGIDQVHHERIFEIFRRAHSGYEGVGLGLAICQRIVEAHGGRMWVDSTPDRGATFLLELPTLAGPMTLD